MPHQIPTHQRVRTSICGNLPRHAPCRSSKSHSAPAPALHSNLAPSSCCNHTRRMLRPCGVAQTRTENLSILNGQRMLRPYAASIDSGDDIESSTNVLVHYVARTLDLNLVKDLAGLLRGAVKRVNDSVHVALPKADIFFFKDGTLACWGTTEEEEQIALDNVARPSISKPLIPRTTLPGAGINQAPANPSQSVRVRFAAPCWFTADAEMCSTGGSSSGSDEEPRIGNSSSSRSGLSEFAYSSSSAEVATPPSAMASLSGRTLTVASPRGADGKVALRMDDAQRAISSALGRSLQLACHEQRTAVIAAETDVLPEALASKGEVALGSKDIAKLLGQTFLLKRCAQLLASSAASSAAALAAALKEQKYSEDMLADLENGGSRSDDEMSSGSWSTRSLASRTVAGSSGSNLSLPSPSPMLQLQSEVEVVCGMTGRTAALQRSLTELQELLEEVRDLEANAHGSRLEWIVIVLVAVEALVGVAEFYELLSGGFKL